MTYNEASCSTPTRERHTCDAGRAVRHLASTQNRRFRLPRIAPFHYSDCNAGVAQVAERLSCKQQDGASSTPTGSRLCNMPDLLNGRALARLARDGCSIQPFGTMGDGTASGGYLTCNEDIQLGWNPRSSTKDMPESPMWSWCWLETPVMSVQFAPQVPSVAVAERHRREVVTLYTSVQFTPATPSYTGSSFSGKDGIF